MRSDRTKRNLHVLLASNEALSTEEEFRISSYFTDWDDATKGTETAMFSVTITYLDLVTGSHIPHETVFVYNFQAGIFERVAYFNKYK